MFVSIDMSQQHKVLYHFRAFDQSQNKKSIIHLPTTLGSILQAVLKYLNLQLLYLHLSF